MRNLTEANITEAVVQKIKANDPRLQQLVTSLIKHLHAFVREAELTEEEWFTAVDFLTRTGQICDDKRQEFILLSDTLGISILVDAINHRIAEGMSESTVFGPFWVQGANTLENGVTIANGPEAERGEPTVVHVAVTNPQGKPIPNALVDVWQADDAGHYDVQDPNQPQNNLRGIFKTDAEGKVWFKTIKPEAYPIPTDGPVGEMLQATGRHPMRPAHIHFMIQAEGFERLITHIFVEGDEYLESDAVFGVKDSLITNFNRSEDEQEAQTYGFQTPFYQAAYTFVLKPALIRA
jgi:hydroxyquinol 1,2-dioxygenase